MPLLDEGRHSWNPGDHPRDHDGQFANGSGGQRDAPDHGAGDGGSGRGMPDALASASVTLSRGGTATLNRHADGSYSLGNGDGKPLNAEQTTHLINALALSDDWDPGETETLPGIGKITRERGGSTLDLDDGSTLTFTSRDVTRLQVGKEQLDHASRVDTGNGDLDVFPDGKKVGFRHLGDDGKPVEILLNRSSAAKISRTIDAFIDDRDDPDTQDKAVHAKTINTNVGKVQVELHGRWTGSSPGDRLVILPVDDDTWGMVIDGPRQEDWARAVSDIIDEAAAPALHNLNERVPLVEAGGAPPKGRRFRARIIQGDIQGSSGYYPAAMLKRDAGVFREGLPIYLDHPGVTETYDRPERSVRDLAGHLASQAVYEGDGLYADVEVYPHWAPVIEAMAEHIGMSIRASGTVEPSTEESVRGPIVTSLAEATSVDFVTAAGAGGKIVALLESARSEGELLRQAAEALAPPFKKKGAKDDKPANAADKAAADAEDAADGGDDEDEENADGTKKDDKFPAFLKKKSKSKTSEAAVSEARNVGHWLESRMHRSFTEMADDMFGEGRLTRDERIALSSAVGDGLQAFSSRVEADCPHLYQRDIWDDPDSAQAAAAENTTKGAPVSGSTEKQTPPDREATSEVTESAREKDLAAKLTEATKAAETAQRELAEARKETADELAALKARLDESDAEKLRLTNDKAARTAVTEALKTAGLHEASHARVAESVCRDLPTTENGALDTVKLGESIKTTIDAENVYVATLAEAAGFGAVRMLGESTTREADVADIDKQLAEAFAGIGLDEKAALTAAHGRA